MAKLATGIEGFDELSGGGLPRHRTSLLIGGPGAGKTVFALQCLVNAASRQRAAGIFVAFEESPAQIIANGATFNWGLREPAEQEALLPGCSSVARRSSSAGDFDLSGMLAMLAAKKKEIGAQWIVFDGIDVLLTLLQDRCAEMREIYRLRDWLADHALTAIITAKVDDRTSGLMHYDFLQFMVDCVVRLERRQQDRVSAQSIQITKYRGSSYAMAEFPMSIGPSGIEVGAADLALIEHRASSERITAGFERLDAMLGGGVFRGSSTLITRRAGHFQDDLGRQIRGSGVPARRARIVRELR